MPKFLDALALAGYCALIYWLSSQPSLPIAPLFSWQDKVHHFSAYAIMSILAWRAFRHLSKSPGLTLIAAVVFCSLFGLSDEWHQSYVPGRTADAWDWLADTLGALAVAYGLRRFGRVQTKS